MPPLPTVRIPELPALTPDVDLALDDKLPIYIVSENKTKRVTLQDLNTFFAIGGGGGTRPPVVYGGELIYIVPLSADGTDTASIPVISGLDFTLERGGIPLIALLPDLSNAADAEFEVLTAGGFKLKQPGDTLKKGERFKLSIFSLITGPTTTPTAAFIKGKKVVSTNTTLDPVNDMNKIIQCRAVDDYISIAIPDISDIPENSVMVFDTSINQNKPLHITTTGGQYIYMNKGSRTYIDMMPGEMCWIYRDVDGLFVINDFGKHYTDVANPFAAYKKGLNQLVFNGTEVNRSDYPRVWEMIQTFGASIVSKATWLTATATTTGGREIPFPYRGCWHTGDGSTTFGVPDFMGMSIRGLKTESGSDADRVLNKAGGYQDANVGEHNITLSLVQHTTSGSGKGVTDGPLGAPSTLTFPQLVGEENRVENIGMLWVCNS